jgi:hypothetical protein
MRFLSLLSWEPDKAKEITERFLKWVPPEGLKWILPPHTVMGQNQTVSIVEIDDPKVLAKVDRYWRDIAVFESSPIMDSRNSQDVTTRQAKPVTRPWRDDCRSGSLRQPRGGVIAVAKACFLPTLFGTLRFHYPAFKIRTENSCCTGYGQGPCPSSVPL